MYIITYLPHEAVAEVSKDKEPIGRGCAEFNWFDSQLMSDSSEVRFKWCGLSNDLRFKWSWLSIDLGFKWFWLSVDLNFKWCGCQLIWDSSDSALQLIWDSSGLVVNWSEIQVIGLSIDLRFKWVGCQLNLRFKWFGCQMMRDSNGFGCQLMWDSSDLDFECFEIPASWFSTEVWFKWFWWWVDVRFKWFGIWMYWDFLQKWIFEDQKRSNSARLPSKTKLWSSDTKLFCETSFKNESLKLKNEAFLRDFLQNWSFEAQKQSFSARPPSKTKLWSSKTKLFCETSFKNRNFETPKPSISARLPSKMKLGRSRTKLFCETSFKIEALKLKNEAFLRDFLQKRSFEDQKRSFSARLPSKLKLWSSKTKRFCETSFKIDMLSRRLTSEFQYVLVIFMWMLQKYCACHEKVAPRHTKSCNCHAKWSLQSNTSVTWNLQPFHGFSVGGFKHRHHRARNHGACHAKRIVPDPLQIHHACQRFCNPHELLRLPRILQRVEIPAPATRNTLWTSKNVPRPSVFNDFDFQIALARRRGANFVDVNFQKCSQFLTILTSKSLSRAGVVQFLLNFQKCPDTASF